MGGAPQQGFLAAGMAVQGVPHLNISIAISVRFSKDLVTVRGQMLLNVDVCSSLSCWLMQEFDSL